MKTEAKTDLEPSTASAIESKHTLTLQELRIAITAAMSHQLKQDFTVNSLSGVIIVDKETGSDLAIDFNTPESFYEITACFERSQEKFDEPVAVDGPVVVPNLDELEIPTATPVEITATVERPAPNTILNESIENVAGFLDSLG